MSLQFRIADQVLKVDDARESTEAVVHKYDAFLNLLCGDRYSFQRDAVRETVRFLVSDKYPDLERLARENWNARETIRQRNESLDAYLAKMPLRDRKSVSLDLATGTGKSFVMYGLAAITLAEGLAERVLVLCPSLTIEEGLLEKFTTLAGNGELSGIMKEMGAVVSIPGIKRGNETIQLGDICVENIHAVYEKYRFIDPGQFSWPRSQDTGAERRGAPLVQCAGQGFKGVDEVPPALRISTSGRS